MPIIPGVQIINPPLPPFGSTPGTICEGNDPRLTVLQTGNTAACAVGDLVRIDSMGLDGLPVFVPAKSDTAEHAAGVCGVVLLAGIVSNLTNGAIVNCAVAPIGGFGLYLSASTAGKATPVDPNNGIVQPFDLICSEVLTGGTQARILLNHSVTDVLDRRSYFLRRMQRLTGANPSRVRCLWDDFDAPLNGNVVGWGVSGVLPAQIEPSVLEIGATAYQLYQQLMLPNAALTSQKWYFTVRIKTRGVGSRTACLLYRTSNVAANGAETIGITANAGLTNYALSRGNWFPGGGAPAYVDQAPYENTTWHTYEAYSSNNGTGSYTEQFDALPAVTSVRPDSLVNHPSCLMIQGILGIDYVMVATEY
jgi:hypothetical protein